MATTWTIAVDWDRNDNYSDTYDDVTSRVISATWSLGMKQPYQEVADNSLLSLVLDNTDKRYSPEYTGSPLNGKVRPFKPVRIQSNDGTTRTHWVGWIEAIKPAVGKYGQRQVEITALGPMQFFKATETAIELQENKRTDEIIAELIKEVVIPPALTSAWVLGRVGFSELGQTTRLANTTSYSVVETGKLTLAYAADNWVKQGGRSNEKQHTFNVYQAIADVVAAERGKFFFDRDGKAVFWNRHHLLDQYPVAATFDDAMTDMVYAYAGLELCKNEIIVECHPRKISATSDEVLWELADATIRVEPGETRTVSVGYKDDKGNRVGGRNVTVTDLEFESGTATVSVEGKANGADLKLTNNGTQAAIVKKCIIRGQKITDFGQMDAKATDNASIVDYGRRTLKLNLPSIDDLEQAQYIADFERTRRSQPKGTVMSITLQSHAKNGGSQHAHQLARATGDVITVKETQTAHQRDYHIIGETHELTNSGELFKTTWYLEPVPDTFPWKLGVEGRSNLGVSTRLTY